MVLPFKFFIGPQLAGLKGLIGYQIFMAIGWTQELLVSSA